MSTLRNIAEKYDPIILEKSVDTLLTISSNPTLSVLKCILDRQTKLDEWLLTELPEERVMLVLEIIEARLKRDSPIFCTQFSPEGWHTKLGQVQVADAILDRIIHDSYHMMVDGEISMCERHGLAVFS